LRWGANAQAQRSTDLLELILHTPLQDIA
jgi:hypothetical protein